MPGRFGEAHSSNCSSLSLGVYERNQRRIVRHPGRQNYGKMSASGSTAERLNSGYSRPSTSGDNTMSASFSSGFGGSRINPMLASTYLTNPTSRGSNFKPDLSKSMYESSPSRYDYSTQSSRSSRYSSSFNHRATITVNPTSTEYGKYIRDSVEYGKYTRDSINESYARINNRYRDSRPRENGYRTPNYSTISNVRLETVSNGLPEGDHGLLDNISNASTIRVHPLPKKTQPESSLERKPSISSTISSSSSRTSTMSSNSNTGTTEFSNLTNVSPEESKTPSPSSDTLQSKICVGVIKAKTGPGLGSSASLMETVGERKRSIDRRNTIVEAMIDNGNELSATLLLLRRARSPPENRSSEPPVLIVTGPSPPSSPMSSTSNITWTIKDVDSENDEEKTIDIDQDCSTGGSSYEDEEEEEEEEYEEKDEWSESEEKEYDAQLTIPLFTSADSLHPNHALVNYKRSITSSPSSSDFDTEFDLTLMVKPIDQTKDQRGRTSQLNTLPPPPIFTASVSYDGMVDNWDVEEFEDEENGDVQAMFTSICDNNIHICCRPPANSYSSESEYEGNVDVGCTINLVDKIAMRDSESECTTDSWAEDESDYYEEEEEEEEDVEEEPSVSYQIPISYQAPGMGDKVLVDECQNVEPAAPTTALDKETPFVEDKSSLRKAPENMSIEDQRRTEQQQKELARQKARSTGLVNVIRDQFRVPTPPKQEPIVYKRSSRLEPGPLDEQRQRKTYAVVKPVINDEFDKQMAELREQMKDTNTQLLTGYSSLSKGINSAFDEAKFRAKEEQHKELIEKTVDTFNKAENERRRWQEQRISDAERRHKEAEEQEQKRQLELKKAAEEKATAAIEQRKVTRRVLRKVGGEDAKPEVITTDKNAYSTERSNKKSATPEKKVLVPTENTLMSPKQVQVTSERRKSIPSSRRKTMELIIRHQAQDDEPGETDENENLKDRKRTRQPHRKNRFTRRPFNIDDLLGFDAFKNFDQLDDYFLRESCIKTTNVEIVKKRRVDPQKIWISQLKDIDKLYKSSELRDIKLDGLS